MSHFLVAHRVYQVNRYKNKPSVGNLVILCERQIEKLNQSNYIPIQEDGKLFRNLMYLIQELDKEELTKSQLFTNKNNGISIFLLKISSIQLNQRLRIINNFVFVLYTLINDLNLKEEIKNLLIDTYNETTEENDENEIIYTYGLVLYNLQLLEQDQLTSLLARLEKKVLKDIEKGRISLSHMSIKEQLLSLPENILEDYEELIKNVTDLSDRMEIFFKLKE